MTPASISDRHKAARSNHHAASLPRPEPVPGAEWQAGVTPRNDEYRVLLDGAPQTLAFAASESRRWCMVFANPVPVHGDDNTHGPVAYRIPREVDVNPATGGAAGYRILRGNVRIVPG